MNSIHILNKPWSLSLAYLGKEQDRFIHHACSKNFWSILMRSAVNTVSSLMENLWASSIFGIQIPSSWAFSQEPESRNICRPGLEGNAVFHLILKEKICPVSARFQHLLYSFGLFQMDLHYWSFYLFGINWAAYIKWYRTHVQLVLKNQIWKLEALKVKRNKSKSEVLPCNKSYIYKDL